MIGQRAAFVYPGQGSQSTGMGRDLAESSSAAAERFRMAAEMLGMPDLTRIMFEGPEEELRRTDRTQPALFLVESTLHDMLSEGGIKPVIVAGHSLGEYTALYAAGTLDFSTAVKLVGRRGELMQEAGSAAGVNGAMAAVLGLDENRIEEVLADQGKAAVIANYNGPGQTVISGDAQAISAASEALKIAGAKRVLPLPVSGAFHSPLIQPAADLFAAELERAAFVDPIIPVISNVDALPHKSKDQLLLNLKAQMAGPVRWTETVKALLAYGVDAIVEVGPGAILTGIIKRMDKSIPVYNVAGAEDVAKLLSEAG